MAYWFNRFVENLQAIIGELKGDVAVVDNSSAKLLGISNEMDGRSRTSSELVKTVAGASDTLHRNLTAVVATMEQNTENTNIVATASEEMNSTISEISRNSDQAKQISEQAVDQMQGARAKMYRLGDSAESISTVTDAIAGISEQTNLLALNATIEAARAGEAGKGFAVVANEIKELASQTAEATADIKKQIEGIQLSSNESIAEIDSVNEVMNHINNIIIRIAAAIEEQTAATREIASNIDQVSQGTREVNQNIEESSGAVDKISEDIGAVDAAARNISANSADILDSLQKLKDMAKDLTNIVNRFTI